jgi:hypothetical protein
MNIPIWNGSSSFTAASSSYYKIPSTGSSPTAFGFYDNDTVFKIDADKVANFVARRLGYPIMEVELQDIQFWTAFEEAITTYGNELYAYQVRDNMLSLEGAPTSSNLNNALITPNMATIIRLSQQYASEAGTGGNITYYSGSLKLTPGVQEYDLAEWAISQSISGGIEIKSVFYQSIPAVNQMYAPYGLGAFGGLGGVPAAGIYGGIYGGGYGGGYLMMPAAFDAAVVQGIELSNTIRLSAYTFNIINNKIKVFPIPNHNDARDGYLWFEYIKDEERITNGLVQTNTVTNPSNAPYGNPTYNQINSIGRQWIFEYTLALCKEMLGYVRGKYSTVPIPDQNMSLNQSDLLSAATAEKQALIERIRAYFDETSKRSLLERRAQESDFRKQEINNVPMTIFIG